MKFPCLSLLLVFSFVATAALADKPEGKKKGKQRDNRLVANLLKGLEAVNLTEEQTAKVKEKGKEVGSTVTKINKEAGLNGEIMKKRSAAAKAIREGSEKMKAGPELVAKINEKAGLTEEQAKAFAEVDELRNGLKKEIVAMLTDEQKAKLPQNLKRFANEVKTGKKKGGKKEGGKNKKKADA